MQIPLQTNFNYNLPIHVNQNQITLLVGNINIYWKNNRFFANAIDFGWL